MEQYVMAATALIGFVNIFNMALEGQWKSFGKATIGIILGGIFGYLKYFGLPGVEIGILLGISSSGLFKIAQVVGVKPTGQPNL